MKTKAAILVELNKPLVIDEIEIPKLKRGQVLVKILASGICRTQLNEIKGYRGKDNFLPHLLGHEASAIVLDTGKDVGKVKRGDYTVLSWIKGRGLSGGSSRYIWRDKIVNAGAVTTFAQHSVVSENRLTKISRRVPANIAAIIGCTVATGIGIVKNFHGGKKKSMAVFGIGGVGASVILGARLQGFTKVIAVDISGIKLKWAKVMGATYLINSFKNNASASIYKICPQGVDYAIEASGVRQAMESAFSSLGKNGKLVIAGNLKRKEKISIDPYDLILGKQIIGSWGGETKPDEDIPFYAESYLSGKLPLDKLITKHFKLDEVNRALKMMEENKTLGRMVINFD